MKSKELTIERGTTHGDWKDQSKIANSLKMVMRYNQGWDKLPEYQAEALDMIATKLSRIICGNNKHKDHWDDIAGYAFLGGQGIDTD